ncbi:MAG: CapA family protein [Clostridia bacterium]|nr:CapA family protein [Clostridia bacterium]
MRKVLAIFLCAVLFLDVICVGVILFTSGSSRESEENGDIFTKATVLAAGANIVQDEMLIQAKDRSNSGGYDFSLVYENIKDAVSDADVSIITQSSVISQNHTVSGDKRYNSPAELGDELVKTGFDVINLATDHILDYGEDGLLNTLDYWAGKEAATTGVYRSAEEAAELIMIQANGIKFGFVAFTESTGGNSLPEDSEAVILSAFAENVLAEKISYAERKADVVIVCANWGNEFDREVDDARRELAAKIADWGADVIIGTHPDAVQEAEMISAKDGHKCFAVYSLGNLVSCSSQAENLLGGILTFDVIKNKEERTVSVENFVISGTVTHYGMNMSKIRVYPLADYTGELASLHGINETFDGFGIRYLNGLLTDTYNKKFLR